VEITYYYKKTSDLLSRFERIIVVPIGIILYYYCYTRMDRVRPFEKIIKYLLLLFRSSVSGVDRGVAARCTLEMIFYAPETYIEVYICIIYLHYYNIVIYDTSIIHRVV